MGRVRNCIRAVWSSMQRWVTGGGEADTSKSWQAHETGGPAEATWAEYEGGGASPTTWADLET